MKLSLRSGISLPFYLVIAGGSVLTYGIVVSFLHGHKVTTLMDVACVMAMGLTWSSAILCMAYGISILKLPVSVIVPLTSSNALIAVLLGVIVFAECKGLNFTKVIIGTLLVIVGAATVSTASTRNINQNENTKGVFHD